MSQKVTVDNLIYISICLSLFFYKAHKHRECSKHIQQTEQSDQNGTEHFQKDIKVTK